MGPGSMGPEPRVKCCSLGGSDLKKKKKNRVPDTWKCYPLGDSGVLACGRGKA